MNLTNLNLMIYHADLQPARGIISRAFAKKQKGFNGERGILGRQKSSAGQMFLFHHHTRVRIPVRSLVTRRNGEYQTKTLETAYGQAGVSGISGTPKSAQESFLTSYAKHKIR